MLYFSISLRLDHFRTQFLEIIRCQQEIYVFCFMIQIINISRLIRKKMQTYIKGNQNSRTMTPNSQLCHCPSFLTKSKNSKQQLFNYSDNLFETKKKNFEKLPNYQSTVVCRSISAKRKKICSPSDKSKTPIKSKLVANNEEQSVKMQLRKSSIHTKDSENSDQTLKNYLLKQRSNTVKIDNSQQLLNVNNSPSFKKITSEPTSEIPKSKNEDPFMRLSYKRKSYNQKPPLTFILAQKSKSPKQPQVSDFTFLFLLGKGFNSIVYLAQHKTTKMLFAIKIISKQMLKKDVNKENLFRQIKINSFIKHTNIVSLYKVLSDQKYIYMVMEYATGGNIFTELKKYKNFSEQKTSLIIKDVARALKYLHENQIIHRDLKLQNVFLNQKVAKIGDLGCAIHSACMRKSSIGSPVYLSPEQLNNNFYGKKIDIWSLGIMTYEMIFGYSPFQKQITSAFDKNEQIIQLKLKFPAGEEISQEAKDFLIKCLEQKQNKRMNIDQVLNHPFLNSEHDGKKQKP